MSKADRDGWVYTRYITLRNGVRLDAHSVGKKVFRFRAKGPEPKDKDKKK